MSSTGKKFNKIGEEKCALKIPRALSDLINMCYAMYLCFLKFLCIMSLSLLYCGITSIWFNIPGGSWKLLTQPQIYLETISISVSCSRCYLYIFLFSWMQVNPNDIDWNRKEFDNYGNCPPPYKLKWFHSNKGLNLINDVYVIKTINCNSTWIWHPFCMWYFAFLLRRHARGPRRLDGRPHTGSC